LSAYAEDHGFYQGMNALAVFMLSLNQGIAASADFATGG